MSSDSDKFVFEAALEEQDNSSLFQAKRWTYVTDSSSNNGNFNGQLQFDLNTLSSQNQWTDLRSAYIQFPVKVTINASTAAALNAVTANAVCIKNGFHQFVDSVQLTLGGSSIQSTQIFSNVNTQFKILSEWSKDELTKFGPSLGVALDDYKVNTDGVTTTTLDNEAIATLSPAYAGIVIPPVKNSGFRERVANLNTSASAGAAFSIMTNPERHGKGSVQVDASTTTANTDRFVAFYLATIRLRDLCDSIDKLPPIKNIKGYLYVNYNAATSTYTAAAGSGLPTAAPVNTAQYGRTMPVMVDPTLVQKAATDDIALTIKAEVSGAKSSTLTLAEPQITNAFLYCAYYVASPEVDRALVQKKTLRYNELFVTSVDIAAGQSTNSTIVPGITNPKRLIMLPTLTGAAANAANITSFQANPALSPFDIVPAGSSPFAALSELQVLVGGQPMFQQPVTMDHQAFMHELAEVGVDGGQNNQVASGLLSQKSWNQLHRFYTVDIGRRVNGDDGASKSILLQAKNDTNANMHVICIVWQEKEITVDTAMGVITQGI